MRALISRRLGLFALVIVVAAGPNGCRNHDMYSYPTSTSAAAS